MTGYMGLMVYSEDRETLYELLSKARELADLLKTEVSAVLVGEKIGVRADEFAGYGADRVYVVEKAQLKGLRAEACAEALHAVVSQVKPQALLIGATKRGKELAPRVAGMLGTGCVSECISIEFVESDLRMKRVVFGGKVLSTQTVSGKPAMATISPGVFEKKRIEDRKAQVIKVDVEISPSRVEILEVKPKEVLAGKIEDATILICGGRGVKQREDFRLLEELAGAIGGAVGCSRPVAADRGWFSEWVGLSGKKVSPDLYVTVGVSGAIQHIAGISGSRIVVSINTDPQAPIFMHSDYGIVGDLYKLVPALTEALRKIKK